MSCWKVVRSTGLGLVLSAIVVMAGACSGDDADEGRDDAGGSPTETSETDATDSSSPIDGPEPVLFSPQGNNLEAYSTDEPVRTQTVITNRDDDPDGWDINGQVCFVDDNTFIAGEDTGQPEIPPAWGVFRLSGSELGDYSAERIGRLVPPYPATDESPDNYGCGVLSDGRVVTTTIGNTAAGPEDGQLLVWFPPFDRMDVPYCVVDATLGTAQQIAVVDDKVYVASARGARAGIVRFDQPLPENADACAPVAPTEFIRASEANRLASPNGVVAQPDGGWYVSSIINGVIAEFDEAGAFVRTVLEPPAGSVLGAEPYPTGTPLGLAIAADGTIYYADLGLVIDPEGIGPRSGTGSVRAIAFDDGEPQPPRVLGDDLTFPDGLGLVP